MSIIYQFSAVASQPPEFDPWEEYPSGLPRPHHRTEPDMQHYDNESYRIPNNGDVRPGDRRLYKKVPVPWNTFEIIGDIPQFNKDFIGNQGVQDIRSILNHDELSKDEKKSRIDPIMLDASESYRDKKCLMCGGKFEDDDQAVRYMGSPIKEVLGDHLPYHEHCMDLINKHCPHLRRESDPEGTQYYNHLYEHGPYGNLVKNSIEDYIKLLGG